MSFDLQRFVDAQTPVYEAALAELRAGRKQTHWMWFIFPQHRALGKSPRAIRFGLESLDEARAYLAHPILARVFVNAPTRCWAQGLVSPPTISWVHQTISSFSRA